MPDAPDHDAVEPTAPEPTPSSTVTQDHDVAAVLKVTSFRRLWLALGFSSFGDWVGLLATTAFAAQLAGDSKAANLAIAGVFILRLAPAALLGPLAGALADRLDRRWTMVVTDVLRGALFISIPLVHSLQWLYVATVLIECLALFFMPAKDATIPNLLPPSRLEVANQLSLATTYGTAPFAALAFSAISLVNGVLDNFLERFATNPTELALHLNGLTFLVSGLVIARLRIPASTFRAEKSDQPNLWREIVDGWRFVGVTPVVRGIVLGMLGAFAAAGFVIGLAQTYVHDLGAGDPGYGVLFGAVFLGLGVGMWQGPRLLRDFSRRRLFGLSLAAAGGFLALLALVPNIVMAVILTICVGACGGVSWVTGYTLLGIEVEDSVRGRTFGFVSSTARIVLVAVLAVGPLLAAWIGPHTFQFTPDRALTYGGPAFVFLLGAVLAVALGLTAYKQMDDRPGATLLNDLRQVLTAHRSPAAKPGRNQYPGVFLAFEGGDGTGKSTQARLLAQWLVEDQGHDVVLTREPGATQLGLRLRDLLLDPELPNAPRAEALMFAADRAQHVATAVRPALARGGVVVTDRFMDSSIAYQGAGRELDAGDVERLSRWACDGLVPDLTILLDLDPVVTRGRRLRDAERDGEDAMESLPETFHERVRAHFLDLARREPHRYVVLDAGESVQEVQEKVRARVREVLPVSARQRVELEERLKAESGTRVRRADAEAEVRLIDAELRGRQEHEVRKREESRRRAREEAEREIAEQPIEAQSTEPAPIEPAPIEPAPIEPAPIEPAPMKAAPMRAAPMEARPIPVSPPPVMPTPAPAIPAPVPSAEPDQLFQPAPEPTEVIPAVAASEVTVPVPHGATAISQETPSEGITRTEARGERAPATGRAPVTRRPALRRPEAQEPLDPRSDTTPTELIPTAFGGRRVDHSRTEVMPAVQDGGETTAPVATEEPAPRGLRRWRAGRK